MKPAMSCAAPMPPVSTRSSVTTEGTSSPANVEHPGANEVGVFPSSHALARETVDVSGIFADQTVAE